LKTPNVKMKNLKGRVKLSKVIEAATQTYEWCRQPMRRPTPSVSGDRREGDPLGLTPGERMCPQPEDKDEFELTAFWHELTHKKDFDGGRWLWLFACTAGRMLVRLSRRGFLAFISLVIYTAHSLFFSLLLPLLDARSGPWWGAFHRCVGILLTWQVTGHYFAAALTDPGFIAVGDKKMDSGGDCDVEAGGGDDSRSNGAADDKESSSCYKCGIAERPARAHHCRICRRCVARAFRSQRSASCASPTPVAQHHHSAPCISEATLAPPSSLSHPIPPRSFAAHGKDACTAWITTARWSPTASARATTGATCS